jgi:hypothetical protein
MTVSILLSALSPKDRQVVLDKLENSDLHTMLPLKGAHAHNFMVDRIAHDESLCGQIELTITYHEPF